MDSIPWPSVKRTDTFTFYTKWGRYRYRIATQGYAASGDAYTHIYDKITMGVRTSEG